MAQLFNIRTVSVPSVGKLPLAENPGTFTPGAIKSEHKPGRLAQDGGFIETSAPAKLEVNILLQAGTDIDALNAIKDEDITIRLSNGETHMMSQARNTEPMSIENGEGKLVFVSNTSEKI